MNEVIAILCLEDSPRDAEIIRELLTDAGYNLNMDCTEVEKEFVSLLRSHKYDLIISDFKLPGFDGFAALRWSMEICPEVPFICVSGSIGESLAVELLKKGAVDYVLKDKLERLPSAIQRAIDEANEKKARRRAERQLHIYAETQTGLLQTNDLIEIYRLMAEKVSELIADSIVMTTLLDETSQTIRIIACKGLDVPHEKIIKILRIDPARMVYHLKDITGDELKFFQSNKLVEMDGGLHALSTRRIPKTYCTIAEKLLRVKHIFTMGFVWQELNFGGLIILARSDISMYQDTIELMMNQAVISINRLRAERKLSSQYALLNALINSPDDLIIFSVDRNYCYTAFNEKHREEMKKVWNIDIEIGMNLLDSMSLSELRVIAKQSIDRVLKGESISEIQRQTNLNIYYEFTWNPIIQNDEVTGATVFIRDISERRRAEDKVRESERKLREAQEMAHLGYWHWDVKTGAVEWSDEVFKIFWLDPKEFTPQLDSILALSPWPEDNQRDQELIGRAIETHSPGSYEQKFLRPDQSIGHYYSTYQGNYDENGVLISIVGTVLDITDRKLAEEALTISETRYRRLFESSKDGILILDAATGKIVDVNPFLFGLLGYLRENIIEKTIWEIGFFKDIIANHDKFLELQRKEYVRYEDLPLETADGRLIDVEFVSNAYLVNHQEIIQCNIRDITERKHIEKSLQKERILLRTVIDNIPSTVYVKDTELRKILVNKADLALIGKPEIEVLGKTDRELFSEETAVRFSEDDQAVLDTGKPLLNREEQVDKYDGQKIWLLTSKLPLHDNEGKITGLVGIGFDITERKRSEEEIYRLNAELEQRVIERTAELSDLYNNAPCGYHLLDKDGLFVRINDTELKWLGYNREEIVGKKKFNHLLTDESARQFSMHFPVFKEQGWIKDLEFDMIRKDGSFLPVLMSGTSITDNEGIHMLSRSTISDNTERKQAEESMFESQNKLEYLNQELEAFTYSVSHDLRAPLRAIDGFTHILLEEYSPKIDTEGQRICRVISENAVKMGLLIDDLLAFSRLNRSAINYSNVDMKAMVAMVFNEIAEPGKKSIIAFDLQELPPAFCDASLLKQVWINLLSNAIKYTRKCENPAITIGYEKSETEIVFYVKDSGVGFEQEFADKLFGVFQRLHSSVEFEGTGVGLAIVKRIINRHGGRVWAEGELNKGAVFYFTLPVKS